MSWWRAGRGRRRGAASSSNPVGEAVTAHSGTVLRPRLEDFALDLEELPGYITVTDDSSIRGFDTRVELDDEIHAFVDPDEDGLVAALAEHPRVDDVFSEDREVLYLSTTLALSDVHALLVHAIVDVNRNPRPAPPTNQLDDTTLDALADQVAATLEPAGFRRLADHGRDGRYFNRVADDGFVQVLMVGPGAGELGDGTPLYGRVWLFTGVVVPDLSPAAAGEPRFCFPGDCDVSEQTYPLPDDLTAAADAALNWLRPYQSKGQAAAWFGADPERIFPPMNRPRFALLFATWGLPDAAGRILDHLDRTSKPLAESRDAVEARKLLGR